MGKHRKVRCRWPSPAWSVWVLAVCHPGDAAGRGSRDVVFCRKLPAGEDLTIGNTFDDFFDNTGDNIFDNIFNTCDDIFYHALCEAFDDIFDGIPGYRIQPGNFNPGEPSGTCRGHAPLPGPSLRQSP